MMCLLHLFFFSAFVRAWLAFQMCIEQTVEFLLLFGKHTTFHHHSAVQSLTHLEKKHLTCLGAYSHTFLWKFIKGPHDFHEFWSAQQKKLTLFLELWKFIIGLYDFHECWTAQQKKPHSFLELWKFIKGLHDFHECWSAQQKTHSVLERWARTWSACCKWHPRDISYWYPCCE